MRSTFTLLFAITCLAPLAAAQEEAKSSTQSATKAAAKEAPAQKKEEAKPEKKVSAPPKPMEKAPAKFQAKFETSKGDIIIDVTRSWAPIGADQFYNLIKTGYYDDNRIFRVIPGFVVQWGLSGDPKATANWRKLLKDDPVVAQNLKGYITYAMGGKNTRTTQVFINLKDNSKLLDPQGFAPFGKVVKGMDVIDKLYSKYGERASGMQGSIQRKGNPFLKKYFSELDYIKKATIVKPGKAKAADKTPEVKEKTEATKP